MHRAYPVPNIDTTNVVGTMPTGRTATQSVANRSLGRTVAYVTHIDFQTMDLKIWAQFDFQAGEETETRLTQLERISGALTLDREKLEIGSKVVARYDDTSNQSKLYRSVVTKINDDDTVELHYMDYGNDATVPIDNIYDSFFSIPLFDREALAKECVVDGIISNGVHWNIGAVAELQEAICYEKVEIEICGKVGSKLLVQVYFGPQLTKLSDYLVNMGWALYRGPPHTVPSVVAPAPAVSRFLPMPTNIPVQVTIPPQHDYSMLSSMQGLSGVRPTSQMLIQPPSILQQPPIQQVRMQQPVASQRNPVVSVLRQPTAMASTSSGMLPHQIQPANISNQTVIVKPHAIVLEYKPRMLKKRTKEDCQVAHIQDPDEFYIQLTSCDAELEDLMGDLNNTYSSAQHQPLAVFKKKAPCVALFSDKKWYRALIMENYPVGVKVQYVDYGNDSVVPREHVMPIESRFMQPELFAVKCSLFGLPQRGVWTSDEVQAFRDLVDSSAPPFISLVHDIEDETHTIELFLKNRTNLNTLLKERLDDLAEQQQQAGAQKSNQQLQKLVPSVPVEPHSVTKGFNVPGQEFVACSKQDAPSQKTSALPATAAIGNKMNRLAEFRKVEFARNTAPGKFIFYESSLGGNGNVRDTKVRINGFPPLVVPAKADDFVDVIVSYVDGKGRFFVQLKQNEAEIERMSQQLNTLYASGGGGQAPIPNPIRGQICAAKYSIDQRWYRGFILERLSPTQLEVFFVDYGNTERMSKADIKELRSEFLNLPIQAMECKLDGIDFGDDAQLVEKFRAAAEAQEMVIRLVDHDSAFHVTLFKVVDNKSDYNINDYLLGKGPAPPMPQAVVAAPQPQVPTNDFNDRRANRQSGEGGFNARDDENRGGGFGGNRDGGFAGGRRGSFGDRPSRGGGGSGFGGDRNTGGFIEGFGGDRNSGFGERSGGFGERGGGRGGRFGDRGERGGRGGGGRFGDRGERGGRGRGGRGGFNDRGGRGGRGGGGFGGGGGFSDGFASGGGGFGGSSGNGFGESSGFGSATGSTDGGGFGTNEESNANSWDTVAKQHEQSSLDTPKAEPLKEPDSTETIATSYKEAPRYSNTLDVYYAYVDQLPRFFVSDKDDLNQLNIITAQITGEFDNLDKVGNPIIGQPCLAMYEGTPYRAIVLSIDQISNEAEILYVDYGNKESKKFSDIKVLPRKFAELYPIAIACKFDGVTDLEKAAASTDKFQEIVETNEQLKVIIKNYDDGDQCYKVNLVAGDDKGDVAVALGLKEAEQQETDEAISNAESTKETDDKGDTVATAYAVTPRFSGTLDVYYAHVDDLPRFFVSRKLDLDQLTTTTSQVSGEFDKLDKVENATVGQPCLSMYEDTPYRATILSIDQKSSKADILYVDYGNKESKHLNDIRILPKKFSVLYPIAIACKFDGVTDLEKASSATEKFQDMIANEEQLQAIIKGFDEDSQCYNVDLVTGDNKADVAVSLGLKEAVEVEQQAVATDTNVPDAEASKETDDKGDTISTTYIPAPRYSGTLEINYAYVDALPKFFVTKKADLDILDAISAEIQAQFDKWAVIETPTVGQACSATFDGTPYRAVILSIDQVANEAEICYVDYGNKATIKLSEIKKLPQKYIALCPFAISCKLSAVTNLEKAKETTEEFEEMVGTDENLKIVIKDFDEEDQCYVVDIVSGGENKDVAVALGLKVADQDAENVASASDKREKCGTAYAKQTRMNPGQTINGQIVEATSFDEFWLSTVAKSGFDLLADLLMDYSISSKLSPLTVVDKGSICILGGDTEFVTRLFRGVITNIGDGEVCDVFLVDYGQHLRSVPSTKLYNVPESFTTWPPQALKCCLYGVDAEWNNDEEMVKTFVDYMKGKEVVATVKSVDKDLPEVEIKLLGAEDDVMTMIANGTFPTGEVGIKTEDDGLEKQLEEELEDM